VNFIEKLFEKHKLVRRGLLVWVCWLITILCLRVSDPAMLPLLTTQVVAFISLVIGMLTAILGFYQWSRSAEDLLKNKAEADVEQP
jgi:hypothetical protein